jgi:hypothetical protein
MAESQVIQNLPPEYIQQGYTNLIKNVSDYVGSAPALPQFQLAGFSPAQQQAMNMAFAQQGFQYDPTTGFTATGTGPGYQPALDAGLGALAQYGKQAGDLYGQATSAQFDPQSYQQFMNPFQDQLNAEIQKQGQMAQNQAAAQQVSRGAYGGSRGQIQSSMIDQGVMDTIGQLTAQNFNTAMGQAMNTFQNQQKAQLMGAQGIGALGQALGQGFGQQAQLQNALATQGIGQMMGIGGMQQKMGQGILDMQRANQLQNINRPMQLYGFMSDILSGAPATMGYQYTQNYGQAGSPFSQMLGTAATALGGIGSLNKMFT